MDGMEALASGSCPIGYRQLLGASATRYFGTGSRYPRTTPRQRVVCDRVVVGEQAEKALYQRTMSYEGIPGCWEGLGPENGCEQVDWSRSISMVAAARLVTAIEEDCRHVQIQSRI